MLAQEIVANSHNNNKMNTKIPVIGGYTAIISPEDYTKVAKYKWVAEKQPKGVYAKTIINNKPMYLHYLVLPSEYINFDIEHINGVTLDNRRFNLRIIANGTTKRGKR